MKDLIQRLRDYVKDDRFNYLQPSTLLTEAADALERLTAGDVALPEPNLYARELLDNGGGIWLGIPEKKICELAYQEGATGEEVREFHLPAALIDYGNRKDAAGYQRGVAAERERCALLCEDMARKYDISIDPVEELIACETAAAIRLGTTP